MRTRIHGWTVVGVVAVAIVVAAGGIGVACSSTGGAAAVREDGSGFALAPVPLESVRIEDPFWSPKLDTLREKTIADVLAKFERDGAMANFDAVRDGKAGEHRGQPWFDGLVYETIAGAAEFLRQKRDPALEAKLDAVIDRIAAAAAKDPKGYINTYTTLKEPDHRWGLNGGNDRWQHDLYNVGCLIEAGVRYQRATGKTKLLEVAARAANLMCEVMGPAPRTNVIPGHALPESAMLELRGLFVEKPELKAKMPFAVDPARYLELAEFWVNARGRTEGRKSDGAYNQDDKPIAEQQTMEGHAVRATLLAESVATLAGVTGKPVYRETAGRWWANMVGRRMYITGGVGAVAEDEKFGADFELPNSGYLETCGSVGAAFLHRRMNQLTGEGRYADELERVLYNGVLGGVSLEGTHYFYENPLEAGAGRGRWAWHSCPCCPPMVLKGLGALPEMIYATGAAGLRVNLYIGSTARFARGGAAVTVKQLSQYPWRGESRFLIDCDKPATFEVALRVPGWCQGEGAGEGRVEELYRPEGRPDRNTFAVLVNGQFTAAKVEKGYARVTREWRAGDRVDVTMDMPVRRAFGDERIAATRGRVAITRGPLVYGLEAADHGGGVGGVGGGVGNLSLPANAAFTLEPSEELGGALVIRAEGLATFAGEPEPRAARLTAVPYFAMANRGAGARTVWIPVDPAMTASKRAAESAVPTASHVNPSDTLAALNDGREPASSHDDSIPRMTWWDRRGSAEWAEYAFAAPIKVSAVGLYWWDERAVGRHCRVPKAWRLFYRDPTDPSGAWTEVPNASGYGTDLDRMNRTTFDAVVTTGLRLEVQLQEGWSGGLLEWTVTPTP